MRARLLPCPFSRRVFLVHLVPSLLWQQPRERVVSWVAVSSVSVSQPLATALAVVAALEMVLYLVVSSVDHWILRLA